MGKNPQELAVGWRPNQKRKVRPKKKKKKSGEKIPELENKGEVMKRAGKGAWEKSDLKSMPKGPWEKKDRAENGQRRVRKGEEPASAMKGKKKLSSEQSGAGGSKKIHPGGRTLSLYGKQSRDYVSDGARVVPKG